MKKTYFASDFHLGIEGRLSSEAREKQIVRWLDSIAPDAAAIYLVGDVFDFWFEYQKTVPKGYTRLLGRLAALSDSGIPLYFFTGNHDMWMFQYFEQELGIPTYREPIIRDIEGKTFFIGHGDGLGPGDHGYKFLKKVFNNPICQRLFAAIHPDIGVALASYFSGKSRKGNKEPGSFMGPDKEWLVHFCNDYLDTGEVDFFVFGHRHLPIDYVLKNGRTRYINLGEWIHSNSYAVFDGENLSLAFFEQEQGRVFG
jgi:UDP-2,3-diacylglucosamine hydrolase